MSEIEVAPKSATPKPHSGAGRRRDERLADRRLMASLSEFVRARVPRGEADDIVQGALAEALAAERAPDDDDEMAAWLHGIARHKIVDWFRRARRETVQDPSLADALAAVDGVPHGARDLLHWAHRELPEGEQNARTLEWMLREGLGEKLEAIAADEDVPAPRVRQRVSRLRKHYRARRAAQIAALALLLGAVIAIFSLLGRRREQIAPLPIPAPLPSHAVPDSSSTSPARTPPAFPAISPDPVDSAPRHTLPVPTASSPRSVPTSRKGPARTLTKAGGGSSL